MNENIPTQFITRIDDSGRFRLNFTMLFDANPETEFPTLFEELDAYDMCVEIEQFVIELIRSRYDETAEV